MMKELWGQQHGREKYQGPAQSYYRTLALGTVVEMAVRGLLVAGG